VSATRIKNPAALYGFWLGDCRFAEVFIGDLHLFPQASWSAFALCSSRFLISLQLIFTKCLEACVAATCAAINGMTNAKLRGSLTSYESCS